jgi:hypothetical protein
MDQTQKACAVCGMPLVKTEDYPAGADINVVDWCKFCGTKYSMDSFQNRLKGMTKFLMQTQGMSQKQAAKAAEEMLNNSVAVKSGRMKK